MSSTISSLQRNYILDIKTSIKLPSLTTAPRNDFELAVFLSTLTPSNAPEILNKLKSFPSSSNIRAWSYINKLDVDYTKLQGLYYFYFGFKQKPSEKLVNQLREFVLIDFKFPNANETSCIQVYNNIELLKNIQKYHAIDMEIIKPYIYKTYQNITIMKIWCINAINNNKFKECKSVFRTYLAYIANTQLKSEEDIDIIDLVETYCIVLKGLSVQMNNKIEYEEINRWAENLESLWSEFENVEEMGEDFKKIYSFVNYSMAVISEQLMEFKLNPNDYISKILKHYENSCIIKTDAEVYYKYSYYLLKTLDLEKSIKFAKLAMKGNPDKIKYILHYVKVLCQDDDNLDDGLEIVKEVIINLMNKREDTKEWKEDIIESYFVLFALLREDGQELLPGFEELLRSFADYNEIHVKMDKVNIEIIEDDVCCGSNSINNGIVGGNLIERSKLPSEADGLIEMAKAVIENKL